MIEQEYAGQCDDDASRRNCDEMAFFELRPPVTPCEDCDAGHCAEHSAAAAAEEQCAAADDDACGDEHNLRDAWRRAARANALEHDEQNRACQQQVRGIDIGVDKVSE